MHATAEGLHAPVAKPFQSRRQFLAGSTIVLALQIQQILLLLHCLQHLAACHQAFNHHIDHHKLVGRVQAILDATKKLGFLQRG